MQNEGEATSDGIYWDSRAATYCGPAGSGRGIGGGRRPAKAASREGEEEVSNGLSSVRETLCGRW